MRVGVQGLHFRVWGLGSAVQGAGLRVEDSNREPRNDKSLEERRSLALIISTETVDRLLLDNNKNATRLGHTGISKAFLW